MRLSRIVNIGKIGWVVGGGKIARNVSTGVEYRSVCMHKYCSLKANVPITKTHTHTVIIKAILIYTYLCT